MTNPLIPIVACMLEIQNSYKKFWTVIFSLYNHVSLLLKNTKDTIWNFWIKKIQKIDNIDGS